MALTVAQTVAFAAASGQTDMRLLHLVCVGFLLSVLFLWAAWALTDVWNGWVSDNVRPATLVRFVIRSVLLIVLSLWMFAS